MLGLQSLWQLAKTNKFTRREILGNISLNWSIKIVNCVC